MSPRSLRSPALRPCSITKHRPGAKTRLYRWSLALCPSQMGADGHPHRGGFLPPMPLSRRMRAGSRVSFELPIPIGAALQHRSTIADVRCTRVLLRAIPWAWIRRNPGIGARSDVVCHLNVWHWVIHAETLRHSRDPLYCPRPVAIRFRRQRIINLQANIGHPVPQIHPMKHVTLENHASLNQ
jgi:hypothetical protein